ncbi:uncharacterized protein ACHE_20894A [Aspergillus chevalieri]|uniref:Tachykinin family protein n=1 Tax=Aspergillus chevalieri TaxID=182096 RepID=A0A7R7VIP8_ASPCH|nr:uncharacterized protein ACHE_20894A [Aspergillus chevalieri]BCR85437.1 hypothetical protein ACHE_20894A [Aspergillus chevalieri]
MAGSPSAENEGSRFTFVLDGHHAGTRNHAMRAHWTERQKARQEKRRQQTTRRVLPILAAKDGPVSSTPPGSQDTDAVPATVQESPTTEQAASIDTPGVSAQLLTGLNHALAATRLDPFDVFPIRLTSQHHKLIHHWLSTHATMMFENMPASNFNPMRDVWFPLDLSNPASFNAIMAHSAAHLAHYYGGMTPTRGTNSSEALKFKAGAIQILNHWLSDPEKALSNDAFAAVVRLLTFERYWGTEEEWKIHRNGLQGMIHARGGLHQLHSDWRLELVVGLVSFMSKPSWFESTNDLSEISEHSIRRSILGSSIDLHKMRCLWLISFIQDMRNLMGMSSQLYMGGLSVYPSLYDAVLFIRNDFLIEGEAYKTECHESDYDRLTCLFAITIMVQESISLAYAAQSNELATLDMSLQTYRHVWEGSIHSLRSFIRNHFLNSYPNGELKIDYVMQMTDIVSHLSLEAHQGIEKCLLNMLCRTWDGRLPFFVDDGGTPDSLLSTVHGY